jgi:apolipoprotein N-acyltransferase
MPFLLACLSGGLTALCFPKFNLYFLAWICLIPLLFALLRKKPWPSFWLGFSGGFVYYAILLYWIPSVPAHYGGLSPVLSFFVYLLLVVLMALSWAAFAFVFSTVRLSYPRSALVLAPFVWVSFEFIYTYLLTGFPWGLLGYSQAKNLSYLQLASVAGVYGLSFGLVLLQSFFVLSISSRKKWPFFLALAAILVIHGAGFLGLRTPAPTKETFEAGVIQGNVSSDIYWDRISTEEVDRLFERHIELSRRADLAGARLIVWPEFTVPLCFSCTGPLYQYFKDNLYRFVQQTQCTLLLGTNETTTEDGQLRYHNTALCLHPDLSTTEYYKMHLVPFGEYTPYKKIFSFIESVTHAIGDVTPGRNYVLHSFEGIKFGSPICYEIVFPNLVRNFVRKGAQFLATITNDGWYGKSPAPYQHFLIAVFRAVENRRFLLRAATTGISGFVDPYGRVLSRSELMTETYLTGRVTPSSRLSFYTRYGDLLPLLGLTLSGFFIILALVKRSHDRKKARRSGNAS